MAPKATGRTIAAYAVSIADGHVTTTFRKLANFTSLAEGFAGTKAKAAAALDATKGSSASAAQKVENVPLDL